MTSELIISKETEATLNTTWQIYKSQWKTFLVLTGFVLLAYIAYVITDSIISLIGIAPLYIWEATDLEYLGIGSVLISIAIRLPLYIFYILVASLLSISYSVIPCLYFNNNEKIIWKVPYQFILKNLNRYILAGLLWTLALSIGFLFCIIPGILISFITPVYVNKITCTDMSIDKAFSSSFQSVFKSSNAWSFFGMQLLALIIYSVPTICTCFIGTIVTLPLLSIYVQHLAYNKGIVT